LSQCRFGERMEKQTIFKDILRDRNGSVNGFNQPVSKSLGGKR
jgi:hypothetical protein